MKKSSDRTNHIYRPLDLKSIEYCAYVPPIYEFRYLLSEN